MKKVMMIAATVAAVLAIVSCEKFENRRPQSHVTKSLTEFTPEAFNIEWEWEGRYWEVSYMTGTRPNITEHEAWYDKDGNWIRTKTELLLKNVPQQIKDYLSADPVYGTSSLSDNEVDYIQTPTGDFYRFDIRYNGREVEIDVTTDGGVELVKFD